MGRRHPIDLDQCHVCTIQCNHPPTEEACDVADDVPTVICSNLADVTARVAETVDEPTIRSRLQEIAAELRQWLGSDE